MVNWRDNSRKQRLEDGTGDGAGEMVPPLGELASQS